MEDRKRREGDNKRNAPTDKKFNSICGYEFGLASISHLTLWCCIFATVAVTFSCSHALSLSFLHSLFWFANFILQMLRIRHVQHTTCEYWLGEYFHHFDTLFCKLHKKVANLIANKIHWNWFVKSKVSIPNGYLFVACSKCLPHATCVRV